MLSKISHASLRSATNPLIDFPVFLDTISTINACYSLIGIMQVTHIWLNTPEWTHLTPQQTLLDSETIRRHSVVVLFIYEQKERQSIKVVNHFFFILEEFFQAWFLILKFQIRFLKVQTPMQTSKIREITPSKIIV